MARRMRMVIHNRTKETNPTYKKVYQLWRNMTQRCTNPKNPYYKNYGEKGITICDRWKTLGYFIEDIDKIKGFDLDKFLNGELSLDKDTSGSKLYSLETCVFVNREQNNKIKPNQQRKFVAISPNGEKSVWTNQSEFSRRHGISQGKVSECVRKNLVYNGWKFILL